MLLSHVCHSWICKGGLSSETLDIVMSQISWFIIIFFSGWQELCYPSTINHCQFCQVSLRPSATSACYIYLNWSWFRASTPSVKSEIQVRVKEMKCFPNSTNFQQFLPMLTSVDQVWPNLTNADYNFLDMEVALALQPMRNQPCVKSNLIIGQLRWYNANEQNCCFIHSLKVLVDTKQQCW